MTFEDLIENLPKIRRFNESYYSLCDLSEKISKSNCMDISISVECFILPFYICESGIYEIYWHRLTIRPNALLSTSVLIEYIEHLRSSKDVVADVSIAFGRYYDDFKFNEQCLFFAIY